MNYISDLWVYSAHPHLCSRAAGSLKTHIKQRLAETTMSPISDHQRHFSVLLYSIQFSVAHLQWISYTSSLLLPLERPVNNVLDLFSVPVPFSQPTNQPPTDRTTIRKAAFATPSVYVVGLYYTTDDGHRFVLR